MSLVDYASSSDEDDDVLEAEEQEPKHEQQPEEQKPSSPPVINQQSESSTPAPLPLIEKLPDASVLLNSSSFSSVTGGTDHASRVAAAMAESSTRKKRDATRLEVTSTLLPRSKVAKGGTLLHTKNVFDTAGGLLVPPQLNGRSNVVTEDISKLFVKRQAEPSSQ